ncbi:hypothetical protein [Nonomuraea angiospora]|uniref:hypothetical protein n=1 Tax=Nonomuraea angiospora TaxID=46172 RepID=UPI0029B087D1|nr:hypothetical protein [Nonomuraea angiospora]MDX3101098.1 hypothetical protein [Nonomuraea angiospora]
MGLTITDTHMTSDGCPNVAELHAGGWTVTGYPGRLFDRNQAITAMLLAELLALTAGHDITQADGPHAPTADDRPDETRSDRTSPLTTDWDAASSAKTTTAPQHSTAHQAAEVPSS